MLGFVLYLVYKPETQSFFTGKPVQEKQGIQKELEQQQVSELDKNKGGVSKSMLKKSRLNFDKIEKCK